MTGKKTFSVRSVRRSNTTGLNRMIEFSLRYSIILWMVIAATCYAFKGQCPQQYACTCLSSPNGDYEIHCPTDENSAFIIDVQQHVFIKVSTSDSFMLFKESRTRELIEKERNRTSYAVSYKARDFVSSM